MSNAVIRKWGNSLALRIPREIAAVLALGEGTEMSLITEDGRLILAPKHAPVFALDELLRDSKPEHFRRSKEDKAWLQDAPVGKELL